MDKNEKSELIDTIAKRVYWENARVANWNSEDRNSSASRMVYDWARMAASEVVREVLKHGRSLSQVSEDWLFRLAFDRFKDNGNNKRMIF